MTDTPDGGTPAEAIAAMTRAVQAYEPEATGAVIASPKHLFSVLLEASRRAVDAAAPVIAARAAAAQRERLLGELGSRQAILAYVSTSRHVAAVLWRDVEDVLAAAPEETP